jgi:radical SAM superfamily enzyme
MEALPFFRDFLWDKFRCRVLKLHINAGLSCPNRDGTISSRGCIFCSEDGSASPTTYGENSITEQMDNARATFKRSDMQTRYIAYSRHIQILIQTLQGLKSSTYTAIAFDDVLGL